MRAVRHTAVSRQWAASVAPASLSSVVHLSIGAPDRTLHSRWYFNTADGGVADSGATVYSEFKYWGTHAAIGGDPWGGDHPSKGSLREDNNAAIAADMEMREKAKHVGVMINKKGKADYNY